MVTRTPAMLEKAKSADVCGFELAADGHPCVANVQKYYLQCRGVQKNELGRQRPG